MDNYIYVIDGCEFTFHSNYSSTDLEYVVEEIAEYYHGNQDGWEDKWPIEIILYTENKDYLGIFTVELEFDPTFHANRIEDN